MSSRSNSSVTFIAVVLGLIIFSAGQTMIFAIAGPVVRLMGLTETDLGLVISLAAITYALAIPIMGRLSDRFGRIKILVLGLISYGIFTIAFTYVMQLGMEGGLLPAVSLLYLIGIRMTLSTLVGGIQPSAVAYVADTSTPEKRTARVALVGGAFGLGAVVGPVAAGFLAGFGILVPLYLSSLAAILMALTLLFIGREPERQASEGDERLSIFMPGVRQFVFLAFGTFTCMSMIQQTSAFFFQDHLSLDPQETATLVGYAMGAFALVMLLVQGGLLQVLNMSVQSMLYVGFVLLMLAAAAISAQLDKELLFVAFALLGGAFGFLNPAFMTGASLSVGPARQGAVAGLVGAGMGAGYIIGPILGTYLYSLDRAYPFAMTALIATLLLAFVFAASVRKPKPSEAI